MRTHCVELIAGAEARAKADYAAVAGTEITVKSITGYDEKGNSVDVEGTFRVIVDAGARAEDLCHWNDEYLDPYWDVTPVGDYPELKGLRSFWTFGNSYRAAEGDQSVQEANRLTAQLAA